VIGVAVVLGLGLWWVLSVESTTPTLVTPRDVTPSASQQPGEPSNAASAQGESASTSTSSPGDPSESQASQQPGEPSSAASAQGESASTSTSSPGDPSESQASQQPGEPSNAASAQGESASATTSSPDNDHVAPEETPAQEPAPSESDSTKDVPADPATALVLLQDWHKEVLLILVPRPSRPGGVVNGPVLIRHAEDALRPLRFDDEGYGDGMEYLCAFSDAVILLDDIADITSADAIRHWGSVQATARWFSSTGRNERNVRRRIDYLKRCAAELRRIEATVGAIDDVFRHSARMAMNEIEKRGLQHFVGEDPEVVALYESCLGPIRTLLSQDLDARWPMTAAMPMLDESLEYLRARRAKQPDGDN
jgi:hypothetical protein